MEKKKAGQWHCWEVTVKYTVSRWHWSNPPFCNGTCSEMSLKIWTMDQKIFVKRWWSTSFRNFFQVVCDVLSSVCVWLIRTFYLPTWLSRPGGPHARIFVTCQSFWPEREATSNLKNSCLFLFKISAKKNLDLLHLKSTKGKRVKTFFTSNTQSHTRNK